MLLLSFYLALAIGVSFFCSVAEAVLLSVRPAYVATLERKGAYGAKALVRLRENLSRPLSAILTANTVAHTVGAAGVGAQATVVFGSEYLGVTSAILTILILVLSEIIPKTLGATHWQTLAPGFGVMILWMTRLLAPFVWASEFLTRMISGKKGGEFTFSREEMSAMAEIGAEEGLLDKKELKIVSNLMQLHMLSVRDIMTPRPVIFSVPAEMTVKDFFDKHATKPFTRIPIYKGSRDDVIGYAIKSDLLIAQASGQTGAKLADFRRDFLSVPDFLTASTTFDRLMHERNHIALVVDEYGSVQGLVSLEDVVETLIGLEITDELDTVEDMQALAHNRWRDRMSTLGIDPDLMERDKSGQDDQASRD